MKQDNERVYTGLLGVNPVLNMKENSDGSYDVLLGVFNRPDYSTGVFTRLKDMTLLKGEYPIQLTHPESVIRRASQEEHDALFSVHPNMVVMTAKEVTYTTTDTGEVVVYGKVTPEQSSGYSPSELMEKGVSGLTFGVQASARVAKNEEGVLVQEIDDIIAFNLVNPRL